jgi:hypothetical protein
MSYIILTKVITVRTAKIQEIKENNKAVLVTSRSQ